jgi:lipopolysaccharide transport system ATP-binding protein
MSDLAIKVEDIGKLYRIGQVGTGTISQDLNRWWARMRGKEDPYAKIGETNDRTAKGSSDFVWALKDVNFEVKQGEVLGIIGRNGAGKSTLLKILSKVTTPSIGRIKVKGRIASLLEVGTGFHPELTGRENIFLNGAILGMTRAEIRSKFDEIVDFAGVERYIDTPVKRYSSGMYVRLAFAVAAFLEPEILIIDEVLAVGDAEFQKKCLGRMKDVSVNDGRTVLFVSHNMGAVSALTQHCILLNKGTILSDGATSEIIPLYFQGGYANDLEYNNLEVPVNKPSIKKVNIKTTYSNNIHSFGDEMIISFVINNPFPIKSAAISYQIFNSKGESVLHILNLNEENPFCNEVGEYVLQSRVPKLRLYPDTYNLVVHFADNSTKEKFQKIEHICPFEVKVFAVKRDYYWYKDHAVYVEDSEWQVQFNPFKGI